MYNGIGLPTPRGSGTSGYVQRNLSYVQPRRIYSKGIGSLENIGSRAPKVRKLNQEIFQHEQKRQVEIKLLEIRDKLEEDGVPSEEIEKRISDKRKRLLLECQDEPPELQAPREAFEPRRRGNKSTRSLEPKKEHRFEASLEKPPKSKHADSHRKRPVY